MKQIRLVFSWALLSVLIVSLVLFVLPRIFNIKMFSVLSASMEPTYSVGDLLYVVPTAFSDIKTGDIITFTLNSQSTVVTHRVMNIDKEDELLFTKGDANNTVDGNPTKYKNIIGVVKFSIPKIGKVIETMSTRLSKILLLSIILMGMLITLTLKLIKKSMRK